MKNLCFISYENVFSARVALLSVEGLQPCVCVCARAYVRAGGCRGNYLSWPPLQAQVVLVQVLAFITVFSHVLCVGSFRFFLQGGSEGSM